jgi:WD repeat-containing protein 48
METVAPWCSVDTRTGALTCVLEENNCFDAELYADETNIEEEIEFKEDQRINLGRWVLRYLFDNLIDEEIRRDENFRAKLFSSRYPTFAMERKPVPGPGQLAMPAPPKLMSWFDATSAPTSESTLKPTNGFHFPQTPGLAIGLATPGPSVALPRINPPHLNPEDAATYNGADSSSARTSLERHSSDYFMARPPSGNPTSVTSGQTFSAANATLVNGRSSQEGNALSNTASSTEADSMTAGPSPAGSASPEKSGIKKFMRMNFISKTLKKTDKADAKQPGPEDLQSDSDSRNSRMDERLLEDSFLGAVLRMRHAYEEASHSQPTEKEMILSVNKRESSPPAPVSSSIAPSLPNETPVLKPPPQTVILIQEDSVDSGGVADLWEGTVGSVGREADLVERVAPAWLADTLLRNSIAQKEVVKISFILEPMGGLLPQVSSDGNTRLNANRMLRARKIMVYIAERIEPQPDRPDPDAPKPEEYLELYCNDQVRVKFALSSCTNFSRS